MFFGVLGQPIGNTMTCMLRNVHLPQPAQGSPNKRSSDEDEHGKFSNKPFVIVLWGQVGWVTVLYEAGWSGLWWNDWA